MSSRLRKAFRGCAMTAFTASLILLAACQTINSTPERKNVNSTLLVIPLEYKTDSSIPGSSIACALNFDDAQQVTTRDRLVFWQRYAFIRDLPPGKHRITRLVVMWEGRIVRQFDEDIPFTIAAGEALLLPFRFNLEIKEKKAYFFTYQLLVKEVDAVWSDLLTYKGINAWDLATAMGTKPGIPVLHPADDEEGSESESVLPSPSEQSEASSEPPRPSPDLASRKQQQLKAELTKKLDKVNAVQYSRWLEDKGLVDVEANASTEKRIELLEQYTVETRTRGSAVELAASYLFPFTRREENPDEGPGHYILHDGWAVGATLSWTYQMNNWFSFGANLGAAPMSENYRYFDETNTLLNEYASWGACLWLGPLVVLGDKTDSFAVQLSSGIGVDSGVHIPIRAGLYYRNFYVGYIGHYYFWMNESTRDMLHGVEAGYSIFLGKKHTWPPKGGNAEPR